MLEQHGLGAGSSLVVVERYLADGDTVVAGNGRNLVFGDNGRVTAAVADGAGFGSLALTLGLVEAIESLIGGSDTITTGSGSDIVVGGIDADTIAAGDGNNIVFGDSGVIDWTAAERLGTLAGDDLDPSDIDRIWSLDPDHGGSDVITTGAGDDIVIAGEDGELVDDVSIVGFNAVARNVLRDTVRGDGDSVDAGEGRNLVLGDNGRITASAQAAPRFATGQAITLGLVEAIESLIGGSDSITTGAGADIVIGGIDADTIAAGDGNNIVFGDSGLIDWAAAERSGLLAGDDLDASDIDRIWSLDPDHGGSDVITTGAGDDIVIAGEDGELVDDVSVTGLNAIPRTVLVDGTRGNGDSVDAGDGQNIVLGDSGQITAAAEQRRRVRVRRSADSPARDHDDRARPRRQRHDHDRLRQGHRPRRRPERHDHRRCRARHRARRQRPHHVPRDDCVRSSRPARRRRASTSSRRPTTTTAAPTSSTAASARTC